MLSSFASAARFVLYVGDVVSYAEYNLDFEAATSTTSGNNTFMANGSTHIPQWTYSGTDGYFWYNKAGIGFVNSPSNQEFTFFGTNSAKSLTHNGIPMEPGNYVFSYRCAGSTSTSPGVTLAVSVNNGSSYSNVHSSGTPYYQAGGTNIKNAPWLSSSTVNVPSANIIRIRFTSGANTTYAWTMIDDIYINKL